MKPLGAKNRVGSRTGSADHKKGPGKADLLAAVGNTVPDVIAPGLAVLFCGINPGLYSAWTRHHFARPGNRFWPALYASGFTPRLMKPEQEQELLGLGYGITNLVERATLASHELTPQELIAGGRVLARKVRKFRPGVVAILGVSAYRVAFASPKAVMGAQAQRMGEALVWVLPNPSGLNAHFTPAALARLFRQCRRDVLRRPVPT